MRRGRLMYDLADASRPGRAADTDKGKVEGLVGYAARCGHYQVVPHQSRLRRAGASPTAPSTSSSRKVSSRREHLDVLALACLAHTSFEEPTQSDEGLGQVPARQWRGLVEGADLLLDQGQVMQRVEDQVLAVVGPAVPGDHLGPAADHHLIDVAPDEHLTVAVGHGHGIVVAAVTHQRQRTRPSRACSAPGSLDTSLSHAAGLIEIAACHA